MNFMILDLTLLGIFILLVGYFLYSKRKVIKKEGLLFLYHTKWGIKLIDKVGSKYKKTLKVLSYVAVYLGYLLMAGMIYFFGKIIYIYIFHQDLVRAIKLPPIMPLIPYLPQMFELSFLPPFYFIYWIIVLAIIAITHEFFHGIFAKVADVKTKTTGFGFFPWFFPVFLAAFVNLDEEKMEKISNFKQRAVLAAGTFANVLTAILGILLMWLVFSFSFSPQGVIYDDYAYELVNINDITEMNGILLTNPTTNDFINISQTSQQNIFKTDSQIYYGLKGVVNEETLALYCTAPAIENNLTNIILSIDGVKTNSFKTLHEEIKSKEIGETIEIVTSNSKEQKTTEIIIQESPNGEPWIGIIFYDLSNQGTINKLSMWITSFKQPNIYYTPNWEIAEFVYDFLWWLVLISISVALVNMLPVGIFDGGRFFYLTIRKLTGSEKIAKKSYKTMTFFFLFLVAVLMFFWAKSFF